MSAAPGSNGLAGTTASSLPGSRLSISMPTVFSGKNLVLFIGIIPIILFIVSIVQLSKFVGNKDDWNNIQPQVSTVLGLTLTAVVVLIIMAGLYFYQDPSRAIFFILIISCLSLGLAYSALAISVIGKLGS